MGNRGDDLNDLHNQGEKDASDGKYDPPDVTPAIFNPVTTDNQRATEAENKGAYDAGYENARKQR